MSPVCSKNPPRGFTLIELLVVIFLIGILIAATLTIIPKVKKAVNGAQTSAQLATIATAIQQYYNDFRAYPGPLANNQLDTASDTSPAPFVLDPNTGITILALMGKDDSTTAQNKSTLDATSLITKQITGSENLVLGLCGGLRLVPNTSTTPPTYTFEYHPVDLFSPTDGSPKPNGPASLNPNSPRKQQAYLNVSKADLSLPDNTVNGGLFTDSASRFGTDSMIPEFIDKFGEPLPILYYRTNVGGSGIAGIRRFNAGPPSNNYYVDDSNNPLVDLNNAPVTPQFDLTDNVAYTTSLVGTKNPQGAMPLPNPNSIHGLQGLGTAALTDPIDTSASGQFVPYTTNAAKPGLNGLAYFKDPSLNTATSTNTYQGVARQKDGFILISAGPDRQYGTRDDIIYPGPLLP